MALPRLCLADRIGLVWLVPAALFAWLIIGNAGAGTSDQIIEWALLVWAPVWLGARAIDFLSGAPWRRAESGIRYLKLKHILGVGLALYAAAGFVVLAATAPHPRDATLGIAALVVFPCAVFWLVGRHVRSGYKPTPQPPEIEIIPPLRRY